MNAFFGRIMWRGGYIGAPSLVCVAWCRTVGRPLGATGNPASRPVKPVTATGFPGRRAVAAAVHGGDGQRGGGGGRALREHLSCAIKKEGAHGLTNRALLHWVSLLSDSNQRPRDLGKLSASRRYNQLPLLRSSPGGFEGSWPCSTYPSVSGCKDRLSG